jgi:glutamine synthetase
MKDLDEQLWRLGILSKTKHNEGAPCQHELAPIYTDANTACDHNQLTMLTMKKCAAKHNLVCLLHEKPFNLISGSGKHNNWSLSTDGGDNLFSPGKTPYQNARFLLFLAAFIKGVDEYQQLLRCSVATAGNDHRLGANEAPPAIISIFLGDELNGIIESIVEGTDYHNPDKSNLRIGVDVLPPIGKDTTDRNRTSPLAFTGNKFEFRMLGSSQSVSGPNVVLNTIMAQELGEFADILEQAENFDERLHQLVAQVFAQHRRILFDGNGYSQEWRREAGSRGLSDLPSTAEALQTFLSRKNLDLVTRRGVFTESEFRARHAIYLESYNKVIGIEARTMVDMAQHQILPAALRYSSDLCQAIQRKDIAGASCRAERALVAKLSGLTDNLYDSIEELKSLLNRLPEDAQTASLYLRSKVIPAMELLRTQADGLEELTDKSYWPYPTYSDLLFY